MYVNAYHVIDFNPCTVLVLLKVADNLETLFYIEICQTCLKNHQENFNFHFSGEN